MDLFRKNKKKQQAAGLEVVGSSSFTDQLDQIAVSAAEMETGSSFIDDDDENVGAEMKMSIKSGIDALIDSDEDLAEIFNDQEESSDENEKDSSKPDTPSSIRSTASRQSTVSAAKIKDAVKSINGVSEQSRARINGTSSSEVVEMEHVGDDDDDDSSASRDKKEDDDEEKSNSDSAEDYSDDEDEGEDGYKPGGYHLVKVGEVYNQRYGCSEKR